jgi:putative sugar O-methyltransferase
VVYSKSALGIEENYKNGGDMLVKRIAGSAPVKLEENIPQVPDEPQLLQKMISDMEKSNELYRPTNYWSHYQKIFLPELQKKGLKNFRRRRLSILSSFGATDLLIYGTVKYEGKYHIRGVHRAVRVLWNILEKLGIRLIVDTPPEEITKYFFEYVKRKFNNNSIDIFRCPTTEYGNPEDLLSINGTKWSLAHLQYCSMFIDALNYITFKPNMLFCELGSGLGRNIEVLAKLYEKATFLIFDIPPQLYVANQYLLSVFGKRVISYSDAIRISPFKGEDLKSTQGKIVILPTWFMTNWANVKINIFWNSASFQEMEPNVVQNYLEIVKKMHPDFIYINAMPEGNYWGEWRPGHGGTKSPVLEKYYLTSLENNYFLKKRYFTDVFLRANKYVSYIFKNQSNHERDIEFMGRENKP